jgi:hypothetical protein
LADDPGAEIIQLFGAVRRDQVAEGLRLIKAFMQIQDTSLRDALIDFTERIARATGTTKDLG